MGTPIVNSPGSEEENVRRLPRILVAEDNAVNQLVATHMLEKLGLNAEIAANGRQAVEAYELVHHDLILMDCHMPDMDGFEAARRIRSLEESRGSGHVPIVAVTASGIHEDREKCLAAGMDDYLVKPIVLAQLREMLERWVPLLPTHGFSMESSAHPPHESAIDPRALESLRVRKDDPVPDFFAGLVGQFLKEALSRLAMISLAVEQTDASALAQAAHSLRGSSAVMGASAMAALCAELEDQARHNNMSGTSALAARLTNEFGRVREELERQP